MKWFKEHWQWGALNLFALVVMGNLLWQSTRIAGLNQNYDPLLVSSGKWAIRFLLLCLLMTPLKIVSGRRSVLKLRKPAGLWAFAFALAHFVLNVVELKENRLLYPISDYIAALGVIALGILTSMAATSTRWAMKRMGKWWKRLHQLVYAAGIIGIGHAILESSNKRVIMYDSQAGIELGIYLVILMILLMVRISVVRSAITNLRFRLSNTESGEEALLRKR